MQLLVDGLYTLSVAPTTTQGELLRELTRVHPDVPEVLESTVSVVLELDRERWVQLEASPERTLAAWMANPAAPGPVEVRLAVAKRCMHGAPAVPGVGYACGWC